MAEVQFEDVTTRVKVPDCLHAVVIAGNGTRIKYKLIDFGVFIALLMMMWGIILLVSRNGDSELVTLLRLIQDLTVVIYALGLLVGLVLVGQTPGMALVGARVVALDSGKVNARSIFIKTLLEDLISVFSFGVVTAAMWFATQDRRGRTWFDRVAGTIVINTRAGRDSHRDESILAMAPIPSTPRTTPVFGVPLTFSVEAKSRTPRPADTTVVTAQTEAAEPNYAETRVARHGVTLTFDDGTEQFVTHRALIGRNPKAGDSYPGAVKIPINDPKLSISKTHFGLTVEAGAIVVKDFRSTNGTRVESPGGVVTTVLPDSPVMARPGSIIRFGDRTVIVSG